MCGRRTSDVDIVSATTTRSSWLCADEGERERAVDMERRLRGVRRLTFLLMAAGLTISAPWIGIWFLVPLALAVVSFAVADRLAARLEAPEHPIAGAWVVSQLCIATSIALTGGIESPALGWLAIPVVTLGARFTNRALYAGLVLTLALLLASTVAPDPSEALRHADRLVQAVVLVASVALLSIALMQSDREHRSESVLDGLTGMLNRRALASRLPELVEQARQTGRPVGLVVGDLDHFKRVNDQHGHAVGDAVLVDVAYELRKVLRAFDLAYRLGGEEFLVLLPGAGLEETEQVARRLWESVRRQPAGGVSVTMSFGVAASSGPAGFDYAAVFDRADAALYLAKASGRDRIEVARPASPIPSPLPGSSGQGEDAPGHAGGCRRGAGAAAPSHR